LKTLRGEIAGGIAGGVVTIPASIGYGVLAFGALGDAYVAPAVLAGLYSAVAGSLVVQALFGVLRVGNMIRYIPSPVMAGFQNAVALLLLVAQVSPLLGLRRPVPLLRIPSQAAAIQPLTLAVGVVTIVRRLRSWRCATSRCWPVSVTTTSRTSPSDWSASSTRPATPSSARAIPIAVSTSSRAARPPCASMPRAPRGRCGWPRTRAERSFGEMALLDRQPRSATVTADNEVVCYVLSEPAFAALIAERPVIAVRLLANVARELSVRLRNATRSDLRARALTPAGQRATTRW
jgi:hypothetical protein